MSSTEMVAPDVSSGVAGTHEGAMNFMSMGSLSAQPMQNSMPAMPVTFAISCRSVTTVRVP